MKQVLIIIVHDNIEFVSDRTLREFLKSLGKIVRRVQLAEVTKFLNPLKLKRNEHQALIDRLKNVSQSVPMYYLKRITKESPFFAEFVSSPAFFGALAAGLLNKVVLDLVTQNRVYIAMLGYLKRGRSENFSDKLKQEIEGENLGGRFFAHKTFITETEKAIIVNVEIDTSMEFEDRLPEQMDEERLIALLEQCIRATSPTKRGRGGGTQP